jgi:hypothetical protein
MRHVRISVGSAKAIYERGEHSLRTLSHITLELCIDTSASKVRRR